MSSDGVKFSKRRNLPTDLVHHTHEVWGPCSYKNSPLRRRGPRVLASYCGFSIFRLHFSTLGHFHMTILATKVKFGWETRLFLFIFVLKYAVPRLQAAARTLQLVINTIITIISTITTIITIIIVVHNYHTNPYHNYLLHITIIIVLL